MVEVRAASRTEASAVMRPSNVREANAVAVLRLLLRDGALPRTDISQRLGLTQGTVTRITAELADQGLVCERPPVVGATRGRPRIPIDLVPDARLTIGVHIGVKVITTALVNLRGEARRIQRTRHDGSVDSVVEHSARGILEILADAPSPLLGVGVIVGGWVDAAEGRVRRHTMLGWRNVDLGRLLSERTGVDVLVESNARAHAQADLLFGEAKGHDSFAHIFIGHVVESALVLDGRMYAGPSGSGGSLENWTMDDGAGRAAPALEVIGDSALLAAARDAGILPAGAAFEDLVEVASGEGAHASAALELLHERAFRTGALIASITDLLGLSLVILSSGVIAEPDALTHVQRGLEAASDGQPRPELRAEANAPKVLTRAATAAVLAATLLTPPEAL